MDAISENVKNLRTAAMSVLQALSEGTVKTVDDPKVSRFLQSIDTLRKQQKPCKAMERKASKPQGQEVIEAFNSWLSKKGFDASSLKFKIDSAGDQGNGLYARSAIAKGEKFLSVPRDLMITEQVAKDVPSLMELRGEDVVVEQTPTLLLALYLMHEMTLSENGGGTSEWQEYLDLLPGEYSIPLQYTIDELRLLQETQLFSNAIRMLVNAALQYARLHKIFASEKAAKKDVVVPLGEFTWDLMVWSLSAVLTRQNQIPTIAPPTLQKEGEAAVTETAPTMQLALIPLWDMCNHLPGEITTFYNIETKSLECLAMSSFAEGQEICMAYGSRPNAHLLLYSGFVAEGNAHDSVQVTLSLSSAGDASGSKILESKKSFLQSMRLGEKCAFAVKPGSGIEPQGLSFLRICAMDQQDIDRAMSEGVDVSKVVSLRNEHKAIALLRQELERISKGYTTTLAQDEEKYEAIKKKGDSYKATTGAHARILERKLVNVVLPETIENEGRLKKKYQSREKKKKKKKAAAPQ